MLILTRRKKKNHQFDNKRWVKTYNGPLERKGEKKRTQVKKKVVEKQ